MKNRKKSNLGKQLEALIDRSNVHYKLNLIASIEKIPTPVKIMGTTGGFVKGVKQAGYLVDYIGVMKGHAIAFDAKETKGKSFPLKNIHTHQYKMLKEWSYSGSTTFLLVHFTDMDEYYVLGFEALKEAWEAMLDGGRKSIPYSDFVSKGRLVEKEGNLIKYLEVL